MITQSLSPDVLQWLGCATGATGSLLLATKTRYSGYGFVLFLISNGLWTAYGFAIHAYGLIAMQAIFTVTSAIGIYHWLIKSPTKAEESVRDVVEPTTKKGEMLCFSIE